MKIKVGNKIEFTMFGEVGTGTIKILSQPYKNSVIIEIIDFPLHKTTGKQIFIFQEEILKVLK